MSDVAVKNPENLSINPYIEYVIRCAKEAMTSSGRNPEDVTGVLRGSFFYKHLAVDAARSPNTELLWGDHRSSFIDSEHIHGIQLYDTVTGGYLGAISIFDLAAAHDQLNPQCVADAYAYCTHGNKYKSVVVAATSTAFNLCKRSTLELNDGRSGSISLSTRMVGIKDVSGSSEGVPKGAGKRIYPLVEGILDRQHISSLNIDAKQTQQAQSVLRGISSERNEGYKTALSTFASRVNLAVYNRTLYPMTLTSGLLAELIFNPDSLAKFIDEESEAMGILRKSYDELHNFASFNTSLKRVVRHDLTTGVVTLFTDWPPRDYADRVYFADMDSLIGSEDADHDVEAPIAVLNIGLQSPELLNGTNYVPSVGLAHYGAPTTYGALLKGSHKGVVHYFIDDSQP